MMMKLTEGPGGPTLPAGPGKPVAPYKYTQRDKGVEKWNLRQPH